MVNRSLVSTVSLCALAGLNAWCGRPAVPSELAAARTAYRSVSSGRARELVPVEVDNARIALNQAEAAFEDKPNDQTTRDLAYIAERRSLQAEAYARAAQAQHARATALDARARRQANMMRQTSAELNMTREQLAAARQQNTASQEALEREQQARAEAERRERAALDSLREVANVREESRGLVISLSGQVLFASGQSTLLPIAQQRLEQVAAMLRDHPNQNIVIEGHTDTRGSVAANESLSLARARAVKDFFAAQGIPAERLRAEGLGPHRPIANNRTAEGRANNRRVEIVLEPSVPPSSVGGGPERR
jgi:outer membrane protein OmpA-like peptidoglycan-associated protein